MGLARAGSTLLVLAALACKPPSGPTTDADASGVDVTDAASNVATDVCSLIEGIDDNGAVRTICAYVVEIIGVVVPFILTLRQADAGPAMKPGDTCDPLPNAPAGFCATSRERAKAILFLVNVRTARLQLDGGAR